MFGTNTVFILGAGASYDYHLPLASELRGQIAFLGRSNEKGRAREVADEIGIDQNDVELLVRSYSKSGKYKSIDRFLEQNAESRPQWIEIGKRLIAYHLLQAEKIDRQIFDRNPDINSRSPQSPQHERPDWYSLLWEQINPDRIDEIKQSPIPVISFNYDRSFEHRMSNMIAHSFGLDGGPEAAYREYFGKAFRVIHVHGHLGHIYGDDEDSLVEYGAPAVYKNIVKAADQIRIYVESEKDTSELKDARESIAAANPIYILGFGFHPTNCERLQLKDGLTQGRKKKIISRTGLTDAEWGAALKRLGIHGEIKGLNAGAENRDITDTLRNSDYFNAA